MTGPGPGSQPAEPSARGTGAHPGGGDERAREAGAHLQRAALEFIEATRALLDVVEEAVREPGGVLDIVSETVTALVGAAGTMAARAGNPPASGPGPGGDSGPPAGERSQVEHIRIS